MDTVKSRRCNYPQENEIKKQKTLARKRNQRAERVEKLTPEQKGEELRKRRQAYANMKSQKTHLSEYTNSFVQVHTHNQVYRCYVTKSCLSHSCSVLFDPFSSCLNTNSLSVIQKKINVHPV